MRILIDDERNFLPDHSVPDMIARNFLAGEVVLGIVNEKDDVWVDHDLGEEDPDLTGYRLLTNFEEFIAHKHSKKIYPPIPRFHGISMNSPGRDRIKQVIAALKRLQNDIEPRPVGRPVRGSRLAQERSPAPWRKP